MDILPNGNVGLKDPLSPDEQAVDLAEIIQKLEKRGIQTPVLLRVSNFWNIVLMQLMRVFALRLNRLDMGGNIAGFFQ